MTTKSCILGPHHMTGLSSVLNTLGCMLIKELGKHFDIVNIITSQWFVLICNGRHWRVIVYPDYVDTHLVSHRWTADGYSTRNLTQHCSDPDIVDKIVKHITQSSQGDSYGNIIPQL